LLKDIQQKPFSDTHLHAYRHIDKYKQTVLRECKPPPRHLTSIKHDLDSSQDFRIVREMEK